MNNLLPKGTRFFIFTYGIFLLNKEKNEALKAERKICFEDVILRINAGKILEIIDHPNQEKYPDQMIIIIDIDGYAYMVPFVFQKEGIFLKTIIPSRKLTKKYIKGK